MLPYWTRLTRTISAESAKRGRSPQPVSSPKI
jgi:hypothetical protein